MDVLRNGYKVKMKTGEGLAPAEVVWYRTPPGAPVYSDETAFRSQVWRDVLDWPNTGLGEQTEQCDERKVIDWVDGEPPVGLLTGDEPCGSPEVFRRGGLDGDEIFMTRANGGAPCCLGPAAFISNVLYNIQLDGTFHGHGLEIIAGDIAVLHDEGPPTAQDFFQNPGPGSSIFDYTREGATQCTFAFNMAVDPPVVNITFNTSVDFLIIHYWGLRVIAFRVKFGGTGNVHEMVMEWVSLPPP